MEPGPFGSGSIKARRQPDAEIPAGAALIAAARAVILELSGHAHAAMTLYVNNGIALWPGFTLKLGARRY